MAPMMPSSSRQFEQHRGQSPPVNFGVAPVSAEPPPSLVADHLLDPGSPAVSLNTLPSGSRVGDNFSISTEVPLNPFSHNPTIPVSSDIAPNLPPSGSRMGDNSTVPISTDAPLKCLLSSISRVGDNSTVSANHDALSTSLPSDSRVGDNSTSASQDASLNPLPSISRMGDSTASITSDVALNLLPTVSYVGDNLTVSINPDVLFNHLPSVSDNVNKSVNFELPSSPLYPVKPENSNAHDLNEAPESPRLLVQPSNSSPADLDTISATVPLVSSCEQLINPSELVGFDTHPTCHNDPEGPIVSNGTPVSSVPSTPLLSPFRDPYASDGVTSVNCQTAPSVEDTCTEAVIQRYEDITKSESDKRHYRALVLSNNMKVMLVSDSSVETSAAALQVNVGQCSDPVEVPGLAHFCEHMLFLGTEKYPEENEYSKFLSEHGGYSNACTGLDFTKFYFNVLPEHLGAALDIFAQFFIAPLFTESATERELNAVDSEHQKNLQSDGWRLTQQDKNAAVPGHPYRNFGTGNRQTLETVPKEKGIDVRKELLRFHQKWYSANIMALSVVGKESLDELEAMVVPLFSSVRSSPVETPSWTEHPFPPELRRKRTYCEPVADFRSLAMDFPVCDYNREHYVGRPFGYLSHLIGHEGPGSLLSALKKRGWCNSLSAGTIFAARGFGFFSISADLTEEGVQRTDDIVALTFQYIAMLRERGPQREVYEEQSDLSELSFRFQDPSEPMSLATSLVNVLQDFPSLPLEEVLATWRTTEWRPDLIEEALAVLTPENVRLQLVAKCFADKCTQEEPWYGIKYLEEDIEPEKIKEWGSLELVSELSLPPPNEFIPSRVELEARSDPTCEALAPEIIKDTPFMRLWYKQDNEFLLPKASIEFELNSPLPGQSPRHMQLMVLWVMLLEDSLQEPAYAAVLAGISWGMDCCLYCISISISGFDDKQHFLLDIIMDRIVNFQPDPRRFNVMKEKLVRGLKNREMDQPCEHADYEQDACLSGRVWWTAQQLINATENATVDMLVDYTPRFLRSVYVEGIAFGNLTRDRALRLAEIVENRIPKDAVPVLAQDLLMVRALEIDAGGNFLREIENGVHSSSCVSVYLECGVRDTRSNVLLELLVQALEEPCYDTLRTKEQLGYIVSGGLRRSQGVQGATVLVQGDAHPVRIEERIEAFLQDVQEHLESMSEEEFVRHRTALAALRSERPKQIHSKKAQLWGEIIGQTYNFDRARVEVEALNTVSKDELIQFYKRHISPDSPERRKLSVHVVSTAEDAAHTKNTEIISDNNVDTCNDKIADNDEETNDGNNNNTDTNNGIDLNDKAGDHSGNTDNKEYSANRNVLTENDINNTPKKHSNNNMDKTDYNTHNIDDNSVNTDTSGVNNFKNIVNGENKRCNSVNNTENNNSNIEKMICNGNDKIDNNNNNKVGNHNSGTNNIDDTINKNERTDGNKDDTAKKSERKDGNKDDTIKKNEQANENKDDTDNNNDRKYGNEHDDDKNEHSDDNKDDTHNKNKMPVDNKGDTKNKGTVDNKDDTSYKIDRKDGDKNNTDNKNESRDDNKNDTNNKIEHSDGSKDDTDKNKESNNSKQPTRITDLIEFKSRRRLHPYPVAFTAVPRRGS